MNYKANLPFGAYRPYAEDRVLQFEERYTDSRLYEKQSIGNNAVGFSDISINMERIDDVCDREMPAVNEKWNGMLPKELKQNLFQFKLNGISLHIFMTVKELTDRGLAFNHPLATVDSEIGSQTSVVPMENADRQMISVTLINNSNSKITFNEAAVVGVSAWPGYLYHSVMDFELPGKITSVTSREKDLLEVYGEPALTKFVEDDNLQLKGCGYYLDDKHTELDILWIYISIGREHNGKVVAFDISKWSIAQRPVKLLWWAEHFN